ncbi:hypothetical protein [Curtobacterium luteum]|uniref:Scaffolding protein n=1 Tax=Curtobacterium luteum TaxID=33881 RepID=A0A175RL06_9MICO|nr:hypothetical protein [Curtobacterium luteum]KTR04356.1 hypothetical protein NS184_12140 [Curtobacterium luteum]
MTDSTDTSTPPWGDDFDAERAWTLVQNLRADKDKLQGEKDTLTTELATERQARGDAEKAAKDADPEGKLTAAEKRAADAERSLWTERALRKHSIAEELVEFLSGDTEEVILAKAEKLSRAGAAAAPAPAEEPTPSAEVPVRPAPDLTPGHGGEPTPEFSPATVAAALRARAGVR